MTARHRVPPSLPGEVDPTAVCASPVTGLSDALKARFAGVEAWVFDLDNTLYPAGGAVWPMIDERITRYLADFMGIDGLSARALQKFYYRRYGTTLRGLMEDHAVAPGPFLDFVHDIDRTSLDPNPALVEAVACLPGRKLILTNGSSDHALRTAERLGFGATAFEAVFDIVAADLVPKPEAATYDRFLARHGIDPHRAAMFEDLSANLRVPHMRGMATVLVVPRLQEQVHRDAWEAPGGSADHIDVVTDDLAGFLASLVIDRERAGSAPAVPAPAPA